MFNNDFIPNLPVSPSIKNEYWLAFGIRNPVTIYNVMQNAGWCPLKTLTLTHSLSECWTADQLTASSHLTRPAPRHHVDVSFNLLQLTGIAGTSQRTLPTWNGLRTSENTDNLLQNNDVWWRTMDNWHLRWRVDNEQLTSDGSRVWRLGHKIKHNEHIVMIYSLVWSSVVRHNDAVSRLSHRHTDTHRSAAIMYGLASASLITLSMPAHHSLSLSLSLSLSNSLFVCVCV